MQMQPLPHPSRCVHTPAAPGTRTGTWGDTSTPSPHAHAPTIPLPSPCHLPTISLPSPCHLPAISLPSSSAAAARRRQLGGGSAAAVRRRRAARRSFMTCACLRFGAEARALARRRVRLLCLRVFTYPLRVRMRAGDQWVIRCPERQLCTLPTWASFLFGSIHPSGVTGSRGGVRPRFIK